MPNTYKILGQINPSANTQTNVDVVPAATEVVLNSIQISNNLNLFNSSILNDYPIEFLLQNSAQSVPDAELDFVCTFSFEFQPAAFIARIGENSCSSY